MKHLLIVALFLAAFHCSRSQTTEDSVKASVKVLFDGMLGANGGIIKSAFADSATLQTIGRVDVHGQVAKNESIDEFAQAIGKMSKGDADERITFDVIKIDGHLALVWAP